MGMFSNPLGHAGYPPGVTGTPTTQPSQIRAATAAEAAAGTLTNVYISPATADSATALDFASPPVLGFGSTTPRPVHATTLSAVGAVTINTSGAASSSIGTGGTGAVNIGNTTGNTAVTGTLTSSAGITATTGNIVASAGNLAATLGSVSAGTTVTAGTGITATTGNITATSGNVVVNGAAKQYQCHGGAVTDFIGQAVLVAGTITVANTNIAATDRIFVTRSAKNASTAYGTFEVVITPATNFVITACKADTTTETNDVSTVDYIIVRQV